MGAVSNSMCNGLEGLFLALVEIDPCEMAKGTITECILDHPFNSTQRTTIIIRLLPEQLSNIIVQHIGGIAQGYQVWFCPLQFLEDSRLTIWS